MPRPLRLLIVGLDGADYYTMRAWIESASLPHLADLMRKGCLLRCDSVRPPLTAPAWMTALTGCNPAKHGVYDFMDFSYPERQPWWSLPVPCPDLFEGLSRASLHPGGLNVPMMYPARESHGVMVSGFGCPKLDEDAFYPRSLRPELLAAVPDYALHPELERLAGRDPDQLEAFVEMRGRAAAYLLTHHDLDVFMVVFGALDWAGHGRASDGPRADGVPFRIARALDREVGRLVSLTDWPKTPVMLLSDHGMRCARRQINLYKLLINLGLLEVRWAPDTSPGRRLATSAVLSLWNVLKRALPTGLANRLFLRGDKARSRVLERASSMEIDFASTTAYPAGAYGSLRLSLQGREPNGKIAPTDRETVLHEVIERLRETCDAAGRPLFSEVLARDEVYRGPLLDRGPDIVLTPAADDMALGMAAVESQIVLFMRQPALVTPLVPVWGVHSTNAILAISGDPVATEHGSQCRLQDFTPTALHLLGLPVPSYMDGRVLTECLAGEPAARPVNIVEESLPAAYRLDVAVSEGDAAILEERLRALGYL